MEILSSSKKLMWFILVNRLLGMAEGKDDSRKNAEDSSYGGEMDEDESPVTTPTSSSSSHSQPREIPRISIPRERSTSAPNVSFNAVNANPSKDVSPKTCLSWAQTILSKYKWAVYSTVIRVQQFNQFFCKKKY